MGTPRISLDVDYLVSEYNANKSVKALAQQFGVSRDVIKQRLNSVGIKPRNRSESMFVRMAQTPLEERKRLAHAANVAKRGSHNTFEMLQKRALAHKRFIGKHEQEFINAISNANIPVIPQEPFLSYNLDIGCGNIAVEIHTQCANPLTANYIKKLMKGVKSGKNMLYVWISPRHDFVADDCYKNVISIIQSVRSNPPVNTKYWVIRGTGELYACGSFDSD
jgi:hypothetical protein